MNGRLPDKLKDHEFDGIAEYDNPLPAWWVWIFWATIIFSPIYIVYYHFGTGESELDQYQAEMETFFEMQREQLMALGEVSEEVLYTVSQNESMMDGGRSIFVSKCAPCHQPDGGGSIGPNLTDQYWIHGGQLMDIYETVKFGVPTKGMIAWKNQLSEADMYAVSAYVGSLVGTDPANPKEPEGELSVRKPPAAESEEALEQGGGSSGEDSEGAMPTGTIGLR